MDTTKLQWAIDTVRKHALLDSPQVSYARESMLDDGQIAHCVGGLFILELGLPMTSTSLHDSWWDMLRAIGIDSHEKIECPVEDCGLHIDGSVILPHLNNKRMPTGFDDASHGLDWWGILKALEAIKAKYETV